MEELSPEQQELVDAVDDFAAQMKARLIVKSGQGYKGWKKQYTIQDIQEAILERVPRMHNLSDNVEVGIANWALINHLLKAKQNASGS